MGFWTNAEITTGILISCFPVLPRFFQVSSSRIYALTSRFKSNEMQNSESRISTFIHAPVKRMMGKKGSDGFYGLSDFHTEGNEPKQSERQLKKDCIRKSLTSVHDRSASQLGSVNNEQLPGQIMMTTRIATELEPLAHEDLERQQPRW